MMCKRKTCLLVIFISAVLCVRICLARKATVTVRIKSKKKQVKHAAGQWRTGGESIPAGGWPLPMTPRQPPPGDPSYISPYCRTQVKTDAPIYMGHPNRVGSAAVRPAWSKLHPTEADLQVLDAAARSGFGKYCPYLTRECVEPGSHYTFRVPDRNSVTRFSYQSYNITREKWLDLPSIPPRSLGTCAIVALGDVLKTEPGWGSVIDSHDTVIRIGTPPLVGLEKFVGSRADIIICRMLDHGNPLPPPEYRNASRLFGCRYQGLDDATTFVPWYRPVHWHDGQPNPVGDLPTEMYKMTDHLNNKSKKQRHAMSGLRFALGLSMSGWCSRLDLYGFSPTHGGHYFCNHKTATHHDMDMESHYAGPSYCATVKQAHSPALDSWILHRIMKEHPHTNTCVYL